MFDREERYHLSETELQEQLDTAAHQQAYDEWAAEKNGGAVRPSDIGELEWKSLQAAEEAGRLGVKEYLERRKVALHRAKMRFNSYREQHDGSLSLSVARQLDFLQMCVDAARCELSFALSESKKWVGITA